MTTACFAVCLPCPRSPEVHHEEEGRDEHGQRGQEEPAVCRHSQRGVRQNAAVPSGCPIGGSRVRSCTSCSNKHSDRNSTAFRVFR